MEKNKGPRSRIVNSCMLINLRENQRSTVDVVGLTVDVDSTVVVVLLTVDVSGFLSANINKNIIYFNAINANCK
jgi:hypothetical protein